MIDSSGRRALKANGTVLDLLPVSQAIGFTGTLLVILFTLIRPEASAGLSTIGRVLFWSLHVGLGLGALWAASRWLSSGKNLPSSTLTRVLLTGFAGALIAVPGYMVLDAVYASILPNPSADNTGSIMHSFITELREIGPWFMISWLIINLPVLLPKPNLAISMDDSVAHLTNDKTVKAMTATSDQTEAEQQIPEGDKNQNVSVSSADAGRFLSTLPGIIGEDVIAVSSDLHYLNVWTMAGRTTVLGNLRDVVKELGGIGMQVHRSHWIAHKHVQRIVGTSTNGACILSNELRVPISRRRWKAVRDQFGRGVVSVNT